MGEGEEDEVMRGALEARFGGGTRLLPWGEGEGTEWAETELVEEEAE